MCIAKQLYFCGHLQIHNENFSETYIFLNLSDASEKKQYTIKLITYRERDTSFGSPFPSQLM